MAIKMNLIKFIAFHDLYAWFQNMRIHILPAILNLVGAIYSTCRIEMPSNEIKLLSSL